MVAATAPRESEDDNAVELISAYDKAMEEAEKDAIAKGLQ